jgi:hypothetical protein
MLVQTSERAPMRHRGFVHERTRALSLQAAKEQAERDAQTVDPDGDAAVTDVLAQVGRPLASADVQRRLLKLNPNLIFEKSRACPEKTGIYIAAPSDNWHREGRRFICGMESAYMPEFSVRHARQEDGLNGSLHLVMDGETRGWRTVLARLIRERLITLEQAEREFAVGRGRCSRNWQMLTT